MHVELVGGVLGLEAVRHGIHVEVPVALFDCNVVPKWMPALQHDVGWRSQAVGAVEDVHQVILLH